MIWRIRTNVVFEKVKNMIFSYKNFIICRILNEFVSCKSCVRYAKVLTVQKGEVMNLYQQHRVYQIELETEGQKTMRDVAAIRINEILQEALMQKASDIHFEPDRDSLRVQFRCDGVLQEVSKEPIEMQPLILNRLKVMAELDSMERRLPQDGHMAICYDGKQYDLRVSTLPLYQGEKIVLRILGQQEQLRKLSELGFTAENLQKVEHLLQMPNGIVLVCGPTGSGKTTTLYSILEALKDKGKNIVTLEDPVEYEMSGVNQVQVSERTGLTFARGLRSVLRQDPDIIMVGEIRDLESAEIAIRLAYTGHRVFASLHTGDALGAVNRMVELGIAPYLLSSCLNGVIAQRLVRKQENGVLQGRIAIQEVLVCNDMIRQQMNQYEQFLDHRLEIASTYQSLLEDGKWKVEQGITTLQELTAVLGPCI